MAEILESWQVLQATEILGRWAALQGYDRCWHHQEILTKLCHVFGVKVGPTLLPSREDFDLGCREYADSLGLLRNTHERHRPCP